jgi:hypothetical protein
MPYLGSCFCLFCESNELSIDFRLWYLRTNRYQLCFDLEGESGIVVRGIGTAVMLTRRDRPPDKRVHVSSAAQPSLEYVALFVTLC